MLSVPEATSAVLALVPDPAGETHTAAGGGVTLPVHTRFVALLRLGEAWQPGEQQDTRQQERGREHHQAPGPAGARTGPPRRPVHSPTKDGCLQQELRRLGDKDPMSCPWLWFRLWEQGYRFPEGNPRRLGRRWPRWLLGFHLSRGSGSQRRTEPHIDIQK